MEAILSGRAKNYYVIAVIAERRGMVTESISNYFKSIFALSDLILYKTVKIVPKDHNERFALLQKHDKGLYLLLDNLFSTYRETYTKSLSKERAVVVRRRVEEVFKHAGVDIPSEKDLQG